MEIKRVCSRCKGNGEIVDYINGEEIPTGVVCPDCQGSGKLNWLESSDLQVELDDIKDKQNDILDKLNDILELL